MNKYTEIKNALKGGMKTNNYRVVFNIPTDDGAQNYSENGLAKGANSVFNGVLNILCQSTTFPSRKIGTNSVYFRGRKVILRGIEEFDETWSCTFADDYNSNVRRVFENWLTGIDSQERKDIWTNYQTDIKIIQLSPEGNPVFGYLLSNAFVSSLSPTDFSDDKGDLVKITVTFSYSKCSILSSAELLD